VKPIDEKYRLFSKGCRLAIDLIQFASKFERAFIFACGNTLVCDDLAAAREVCFEKNQKVKAVTLDGTIIHKAGMITGGRSADISNNAGKWEEKDLDQLRCLKDRLESQIDELARSKRALADEQLLRDKIAALESQIVSNEEDLSVISRKLQSIEEEYAHNVSLISIEVKKKSKAQNDISVIQNEMKDMIDLLNQKEDDIFRDFCAQAGFHDIREYESNQKSHQIVEKCIQFTKQRALLESELLFAYDRLTKVREKMDNLQSIAEKDDSMLLGLGTEREKLAAQVDSIRSDLSNSSSLLEALSSETARKRNDMIVIQQEYQIGVHNSESLTKELMGMVYLTQIKISVSLIDRNL
jgi:structural maintenance of chromosome 1